ncbi:MAG: hypothetical protein WCJ84_00370 [Candidatus Peregrinibacteria bacterium]
MKFKFPSMSHIVFLLMAVTVCASFLIGKLSENNFMLLSSMVFGAFYAYSKGKTAGDGTLPTAPPIQEGTTELLPPQE